MVGRGGGRGTTKCQNPRGIHHKSAKKDKNRRNLVKNVKQSRTSRESSRNTRGALTRGTAVNTENRRWEKWQKAEIRQNTDTVWTAPNPETRQILPQNQYNLQEPKRSRAPKHRYSLYREKYQKIEISPKLLSTRNAPRRHGFHVNSFCV